MGSLLLANFGCASAAQSSGSAPFVGPEGCYVVLLERQSSGPELDFLFPAFFALDSLAAPDALTPGRQVWLPRDDLSRRAGSWSWTQDGDSVSVATRTPTQGWRLRFGLAPSTWNGRLEAWAGDTESTWVVGGRRVICPAGLVPAQQ